MLYSLILHMRFSSTWDVGKLTSILLPKYLKSLQYDHPILCVQLPRSYLLKVTLSYRRTSSTKHRGNLTSISLPKDLNLLDHTTIAICFLIQIYSIMCCMLVVTNENLKYSLNRQINLSSTTQIHCLYTLTVLLHITSLLYYLTMVLHDFRIKWDKNLDVMLW